MGRAWREKRHSEACLPRYLTGDSTHKRAYHKIASSSVVTPLYTFVGDAYTRSIATSPNPPHASHVPPTHSLKSRLLLLLLLLLLLQPFPP